MIMHLKELRDRRGMTQGDLARTLRVSPSAVGMWEQGRRDPNNEALIKIANYFGVTTDFLLGKDTTTLPLPEPPSTLTREENSLLDSFRRLPTESKKVDGGSD